MICFVRLVPGGLQRRGAARSAICTAGLRLVWRALEPLGMPWSQARPSLPGSWRYDFGASGNLET